MNVFRVFLVCFLLLLTIYTAVTIGNHGWNLFPYFFGDMAEMTWAGQFNFDFMGFLFLSAIWTMWRNQYSAAGIGLGVLAFLGGMAFLAIYLLYLSARCHGDIQRMILGNRARQAVSNNDSADTPAGI